MKRKASIERARGIIQATGTNQEIADKFGVCKNYVCDVRNGRVWPHMSGYIDLPPKRMKMKTKEFRPKFAQVKECIRVRLPELSDKLTVKQKLSITILEFFK